MIFFDFIIKTRWDINNNFKLENINIKNDKIYTPLTIYMVIEKLIII